MALVMEFAPHGNLASHLIKAHPLPQKFRLRIAVNVADALTYLHAFKPPILHRDIKSHNVLVRGDERSKGRKEKRENKERE